MKSIKQLASFLIVCLSINVNAMNKDEEKSIVIFSAEGYKSELISLNRDIYPGTIKNPYKFKLFFKNVTLEHGELVKVPKKMSLVADVSDDYIFLNEDRVALLVDVSDPEKYELLDYNKISSTSCFWRKKMDSSDNEFYFSRKYINLNDKNDATEVESQLCIKIISRNESN